MLIQGYNNSEESDEKMTSSSVKKYERDDLIKIGNQNKSVFSVPESFLELAKEAGSSSPTRQVGTPLGAPVGVIPPLSRANSRSSSGSLYGASLRNSNGHGFGGGSGGGGFGLFGPLVIPPPPPSSREPKVVIKTHTVEKLLPSNPNAWKPGRLKQNNQVKDEQPKTEEELVIEGIVKETRGILNKLTPENFERLMEKFNSTIPLQNKEHRISAVINVLFEKAIDEPGFSTAYAKMVQAVCSPSAETSRIFRKEILDKCQHEFQRSDTEEVKVTELTAKLKDAENEEKKEHIKAELEELNTSMRKRALGNVRFIGELYKLDMLTPRIMVSCIRLLLANPDDEKLECLCKLLTTVGKKLDDQLKDLEQKAKKEGKPGPEEKLLDKFFATLDKLSEDKKISSRIRFAIMDLVELRQSQWRPRRVATGPKTIEEVHRDAYLQEIEEKQKIQSLPPLSPDGTPGSGRGGHRDSMPHNFQNVPKKQDWTTVQNKGARFARKPAGQPGQGQGFPSPSGAAFGSR